MLPELTQNALLDLLLELELERRSVEIVIMGRGGRALLALREGRLVEAEFGGRRGLAALADILALRGGHYQVLDLSPSTGTSLDLEVGGVVLRARHPQEPRHEAPMMPCVPLDSGTQLGFPQRPASSGDAQAVPTQPNSAAKSAAVHSVTVRSASGLATQAANRPSFGSRTLVGGTGYSSSPPPVHEIPASPKQPTQGPAPSNRVGLGGATLLGTKYSSAPPPALGEDRVPAGARALRRPNVAPLGSTLPGAVASPVGAFSRSTGLAERREQDPDTGPIPSTQLDPSSLQRLEELHEAISSTSHPIPLRPVQIIDEWPGSAPVEPPPEEPGRDLLPRVGRYEVLARLKSGGMGSIYLCRLSGSAGFQRLFAMKVLHKELVEQPEALDMFFSEARLLAELHHPHIVGIVDVGTVAQPYLVLDYVEGGSLHELLQASSNALEPGVVLSIVLDALRGLSAAHQLDLGIVHNDISPQNLLVGVDGTCRVADFGVAKSRGFSPGSITTRGKPSYVAPERLLEQPFDHRADIFSCGVVLYQALTGVDPFRGATAEETLRNVLERVILPPSEVGLRPPPALDWVCMKALARNPVERFQSAEEMANQLRRVAAREDLLVAPSMVAQFVRAALGPSLEARRVATQKGLVAESGRRSTTIPPQEGLNLSLPPPVGDVISEPPPSSGEFRDRTEVLSLPSPPSARRRLPTITLYAVLILTTVALGLVIFFPDKIRAVFRKQPARALSSEEALLQQRSAASASSDANSTPPAGAEPQPDIRLPPIETRKDTRP